MSRRGTTSTFSGRLLVTDSTNTSGTSFSDGSCNASQTDPVAGGQGLDDSCEPVVTSSSDHVVTSAPGVPLVLSRRRGRYGQRLR